MNMSRRDFVRAATLTGAGVAVGAGLAATGRSGDRDTADVKGDASIRKLDVLPSVPAAQNEDVLVRMQRELAKAMAKPMEERHWVMIIDQRKCVGCHACTISCVAENHLPPGVVYRPVITEERGEFPNLSTMFTPRPCMQCDEPPCTPVCPVSATWKRADGIVAVDYDACIGCRACLTACPYGARTSDFGESYGHDCGDAGGACSSASLWETTPSHEYGKEWTREDHGSPVGNARKCHFCLHRLEAAQLPSCTTTCIGRATFFGDLNDPDSLVAELIAKNNVYTLLPHKGTKPRVFYIR